MARIPSLHLDRLATVDRPRSHQIQGCNSREFQLLHRGLVPRAKASVRTEGDEVDSDFGGEAYCAGERRTGRELPSSMEELWQVGCVLIRQILPCSRRQRDWCALPQIRGALETRDGDQDGAHDREPMDDQLVVGDMGTLGVMTLGTVRSIAVFAEGTPGPIPAWLLEPAAARRESLARLHMNISAFLLNAAAVGLLLDGVRGDPLQGRHDETAEASKRRPTCCQQGGSYDPRASEVGGRPADGLPSEALDRSRRAKSTGGE